MPSVAVDDTGLVKSAVNPAWISDQLLRWRQVV